MMITSSPKYREAHAFAHASLIINYWKNEDHANTSVTDTNIQTIRQFAVANQQFENLSVGSN